MQVDFTKPRLMKFIEDQVQSGNYPSPQAVIETAVEQLMLSHEPLSDAAIAAISNADAQYERGEFVEWSDVRGELRKRFLGE